MYGVCKICNGKILPSGGENTFPGSQKTLPTHENARKTIEKVQKYSNFASDSAY